MRYLLIAEIKDKGDTKYRIYDTNDDKFLDVDINKLINIDTSNTNFRINSRKQIKRRIQKISLEISKIENGSVSSSHDTLLSINEDGTRFRLLDCHGIKRECSLNEYIELRKKSIINNEAITIKDNAEYIQLSLYNKNAKVEFIRLSKDTNSINDNNIKAQNSCKLNKCIEDKKIRTVDETQNYIDNIGYKNIILNMYPSDRITVTYEMFKMFEYSMIRILDSNIENTIKIVLCKIVKNKENNSYLYAIIKFDDINRICQIQALGHSDIKEKKIEHDLNTICNAYLKWVKDSKYSRI